jgi:CHAT domain-containing protein/tetratricopeptide (TPR) repeat protein
LVSREKRERIEQLADEGWAALEGAAWAVAEKHYSDAMKLARESGEPALAALMRSYRGESRRGQGRLEEAREDMEHALAVAKSENEPQLVAHTEYSLAALDVDISDFSKAHDRLMNALEAALVAKDVATTEASLAMLGHIYRETGDLERSSQCFERALEARPDSPNKAAWFGNLGNTLAEMGMFEKAIDVYKAAVESARAQGDLGTEAKCYASEGFAHLQNEDNATALECYQKALDLAHEATPHFKSSWLGAIGNVYLRLGQTDKAWEMAEEGLQLAKELADKHEEAAHLDTLGDCLLIRGEVEDALTHFSHALEIGRSISDRLGERIYLANIARTYKRMGDSAKALEFFRTAIQLFEQQRSNLKSDAYKTSFAGTGQNLYRDTIQVCLEAGQRVEALEYVGRAKSRAILDLLNNSPIDISEVEAKEGDESISLLIARERELSQQIASLERIYWQGPLDMDSGHRGSTVTAEDAPKLYDEWLEVVDKLRRRHPNYADMVAVDTMRFDQLMGLWDANGSKAKLPPETAIIEYFLSDQFLFSAAIWAGAEQPEINIVFDSKELAGLLNDVADFLEMSSTEGWEVPVSLCKRMYHRLFGDIGKKLPAAITRLIVVPHGVLHKLPFAALHDGAGYLIERYSLSYLPTASLVKVLPELSAAEEGTPDNLRYLVSAISDYSATRTDGIVFSSRLRSAAGLDDLSYTLEEGKTVHKLASKHVTDSRLLTNEEVKEGLLNLFCEYPVVHFAGHAVFVPEQPMLSGLVLSDGSILTAARILHSNALRTKCGKLLVLSACQTGVSVITSGGEILGLARALMYAGMPNLILSLWEVADRSTAELMEQFHNAWQAGKTSIAEALAIAQRQAAREGQPIHAWAPFIHLGID